MKTSPKYRGSMLAPIVGVEQAVSSRMNDEFGGSGADFKMTDQRFMSLMNYESARITLNKFMCKR